ncbi:MAG TPA: ABC transporter ATP-binding protein [Clostridia bacterium]|nr:ABC transporter ATP-binding protein [Clostridia bacterium]
MSIAECSHLYKRYGSCEVVSDLSFRVDEGEILGLLGPNGAGKTTTIKMMLGLTVADSGTIRIKAGEGVGYSPETPYFHPFLTGREVLRFYSRLQKIGKAGAEEQINQLLGAVGLEASGDKKTGTYSKGMLQRLAAAQAMLGDPGLLILDEPTSGLDAIGRMEMIRLILDLKRKGRSVIINSHILSDVEKVADRVVFIVKGRNAGEVEKREYMETGLETLFMKAAGIGTAGTTRIRTNAEIRTESAAGDPTGGSEDICAL